MQLYQPLDGFDTGLLMFPTRFHFRDVAKVQKRLKRGSIALSLVLKDRTNSNTDASSEEVDCGDNSICSDHANSGETSVASNSSDGFEDDGFDQVHAPDDLNLPSEEFLPNDIFLVF